MEAEKGRRKTNTAENKKRQEEYKKTVTKDENRKQWRRSHTCEKTGKKSTKGKKIRKVCNDNNKEQIRSGPLELTWNQVFRQQEKKTRPGLPTKKGEQGRRMSRTNRTKVILKEKRQVSHLLFSPCGAAFTFFLLQEQEDGEDGRCRGKEGNKTNKREEMNERQRCR